VAQNSIREGEVLVISVPGKRFRNAVPTCVLLSKNFRNGVPVRSVTKIFLVITMIQICFHLHANNFQNIVGNWLIKLFGVQSRLQILIRILLKKLL
jgi:hypothetical protein